MHWSRRQFVAASSAIVAGAFGRPFVSGQQPQAGQSTPQVPPPTAFTPLRRNVGIFTGGGGTIGWLISPAGVVVVDAQMPPSSVTCLDGINERSSKRPIDCLFNTHHHGDHTGGNATFRPVTKKIVAHVKVPELQKATAKPGTESSLVPADTTFTDRWSTKLGSETVSAIHYGPGHTAGDSFIVFEQANIVHMGDLVFNRRLPVTDRPGGCSIAGWISVLERVTREHPADTVYIFGHAKPDWKVTGTQEDLLFQRDFLSALLSHVRGEIKAGKSRDEIVKVTPELKGFPDQGALTERVLTAAYEELTTG